MIKTIRKCKKHNPIHSLLGKHSNIQIYNVGEVVPGLVPLLCLWVTIVRSKEYTGTTLQTCKNLHGSLSFSYYKRP